VQDATGADLPQFVKDEFDAFLECGTLAHGSLRLRCAECGHDKLVAFSGKGRGFCPSCGARRMARTAANLVDPVTPHAPVQQWVLELPIPLRPCRPRGPAARPLARHGQSPVCSCPGSALANEPVQCDTAGRVVLKLKTPRRDGTTHLVLNPLEFMQRLAALVPRPRLHPPMTALRLSISAAVLPVRVDFG